MGRPESRDEYRREMAEAFARVLEEKGLEWRQDWRNTASPRNGVTGACYRGSNAFWLGLTAMTKGCGDPRWVTMVQIMDRDGRYHPKEKWHLKKGSRATYVEYWFPYDVKAKKAVTWEAYGEALRNGRKPEEFRLSARYTPVFNACDVEGMSPAPELPDRGISVDGLVERLAVAMEVPVLLDGGDRAYYSRRLDEVHLPAPGAFESAYAFNAAALHELAHSTGHPSRLNRSMGSGYGTEDYAFEELVAEMSSCFTGFGLTEKPGAAHLENHRAYVWSWIRAVRNRPETLIKAIRDAQAAASYMDWKAGLITEKEYEESRASSFEMRTPGRDIGEAR